MNKSNSSRNSRLPVIQETHQKTLESIYISLWYKTNRLLLESIPRFIHVRLDLRLKEAEIHLGRAGRLVLIRLEPG